MENFKWILESFGRYCLFVLYLASIPFFVLVVVIWQAAVCLRKYFASPIVYQDAEIRVSRKNFKIMKDFMIRNNFPANGPITDEDVIEFCHWIVGPQGRLSLSAAGLLHRPDFPEPQAAQPRLRNFYLKGWRGRPKFLEKIKKLFE
jgi:hypothetical protein